MNPEGGKWWRVRYRWEGKEQALSLGTYPTVSLKRAREGRDAIRQQLRDEVNPAEARKVLDLALQHETFESQARL